MNPNDLYRAPNIQTDSLESVQKSLEGLSKWNDLIVDHDFNVTRTWVGPVLDLYRASQPTAILALRSHDWILRYGGLYVLLHFWDKCAEVSQICEKLAAYDPDDRVKHLAIIYISDFYYGSKRLAIANLLAKIVLSEIDTKVIRAEAYRGLLAVISDNDSETTKYIKICFPSSVNWNLVKTYSENVSAPEVGKRVRDS